MESNEEKLNNIGDTLEKWNINNERVLSGSAAHNILLESAKSGDRFHIALFGMNLSDLKVETLGLAIKADPSLEKTILILLAPHPPDDSAHLYDLGFSDVIIEPFSEQSLIDTLNSAWSKNNQGS